MTKKFADHLHKYARKIIGNKGYKVYKCTVPGCTHYVRMILASGRICQCNRCGEPMVMTKYAMTLAKPHCDDCIKKKDSERVNKLGELFA